MTVPQTGWVRRRWSRDSTGSTGRVLHGTPCQLSNPRTTCHGLCGALSSTLTNPHIPNNSPARRGPPPAPAPAPGSLVKCCTICTAVLTTRPVRASARRYSPDQLYAVVSNVDQYHQFVPWCQRSTVLRRQGPTYMEAEMEVGFQMFVERCVTVGGGRGSRGAARRDASRLLL